MAHCNSKEFMQKKKEQGGFVNVVLDEDIIVLKGKV